MTCTGLALLLHNVLLHAAASEFQNGDDSCRFANDGACQETDEEDYACVPGTDCTDCTSAAEEAYKAGWWDACGDILATTTMAPANDNNGTATEDCGPDTARGCDQDCNHTGCWDLDATSDEQGMTVQDSTAMIGCLISVLTFCGCCSAASAQQYKTKRPTSMWLFDTCLTFSAKTPDDIHKIRAMIKEISYFKYCCNADNLYAVCPGVEDQQQPHYVWQHKITATQQKCSKCLLCTKGPEEVKEGLREAAKTKGNPEVASSQPTVPAPAQPTVVIHVSNGPAVPAPAHQPTVACAPAGPDMV